MAAFAGPLVVIILLALRPLCGISIDPLIALPLGGLVCVFVTGNAKDTISITEFGLSKVIGVSILLIDSPSPIYFTAQQKALLMHMEIIPLHNMLFQNLLTLFSTFHMINHFINIFCSMNWD